MTKPKTFLILDGKALIIRACLTNGPKLLSPTGEQTKGAYFFTRVCFKLCREFKPDFIALAMDADRRDLAKTKRCPSYKATRPSAPTSLGLGKQVTQCLKIAKALGISIVSCPGEEADDVIATLVEKAPKDVDCVVISTDKDLQQLVNDRVTIYDPFKSSHLRTEGVRERWGVEPGQIADMQILAGDRVDNVLGVAGVGLKTAKDLILSYGSLGGILAAKEKLKPKIREALEETDLEMLRFLVELKRDLPITIKMGALKFAGPTLSPEAKAIFRKLGFQRWA